MRSSSGLPERLCQRNEDTGRVALCSRCSIHGLYSRTITNKQTASMYDVRLSFEQPLSCAAPIMKQQLHLKKLKTSTGREVQRSMGCSPVIPKSITSAKGSRETKVVHLNEGHSFFSLLYQPSPPLHRRPRLSSSPSVEPPRSVCGCLSVFASTEKRTNTNQSRRGGTVALSVANCGANGQDHVCFCDCLCGGGQMVQNFVNKAD